MSKKYLLISTTVILFVWVGIYFISYETTKKRLELLNGYMTIDKNTIYNKDIQALLDIKSITNKDTTLNNSLFYITIENIALTLNTDTMVQIYDRYIVFEIPKHMHIILFLCIIFISMIFLVYNKISEIKSNKEKKTNNILNLQNAESKLAGKNLSLLAENIHHELKTPMLVIVNKLEFIRDESYVLLEVLKTCEKCNLGVYKDGNDSIVKIQKAIDLIETHIDIIYNLLDRMKNFKNIKRSTENKSIYEVINVAFQTLELFSKNKFKYTIDPRLRQYKAYGNITNEDILNIFINHIKNSLEANSNKLEVLLIKYHKNMIFLQLLDNGSGIPESAISSIYLANFSTKEINKIDAETRGIGLYLSRTTLLNNGGDDFLIETSDQGTSFGINIPSLRR